MEFYGGPKLKGTSTSKKQGNNLYSQISLILFSKKAFVSEINKF